MIQELSKIWSKPRVSKRNLLFQSSWFHTGPLCSFFFPCVVWTFLTKWLQYSDFVEKVSIVIIVDVYIYFLLFM